MAVCGNVCWVAAVVKDSGFLSIGVFFVSASSRLLELVHQSPFLSHGSVYCHYCADKFKQLVM